MPLGANALGSITQIAELGQTQNFTPDRVRGRPYDALLRLTSGGTAAAPESYVYDAEGKQSASHLSIVHVLDTAKRCLIEDGVRSIRALTGLTLRARTITPTSPTAT